MLLFILIIKVMSVTNINIYYLQTD